MYVSEEILACLYLLGNTKFENIFGKTFGESTIVLKPQNFHLISPLCTSDNCTVIEYVF